MSAPRVLLIPWNAAEARRRTARLRSAGYAVARAEPTPAGFRALREAPPAAVVIDLSLIPSHGRDVALAFRQDRRLRRVPLIFVEGDPGKVAGVRKLLPDASYATWGRIRGALRQAIARPPGDPVVPESRLAGYSGTPLPKKLGIRAGSVVALAGAPPGFEATLDGLPEGARLTRRVRGRPDLTIWFTRSRQELEVRIERMAPLAAGGGLWIAWPKKAARTGSDLSEADVRRAGLAAGLVDFKVCAVDETWSGLRFSLRRRG